MPPLLGAELRLIAAIREATGQPSLDWDGPVTPLNTGRATLVYRGRLSGLNTIRGDVVARIMPDPYQARREMAVQRFVAGQGFPTPHVLISSERTEALEQSWMVMEHIDGRPMLSRRHGSRLLGGVIRSYWDVPRVLAALAARVHALDVRPIVAQLGSEAVAGSSLARMRALAVELNSADLIRRADELLASRPAFERSALCHGDIQPFNVIRAEREHEDRHYLLDWSYAQYDDPHYDLAATHIMLSYPPLSVPAPLERLAVLLSRGLRRRFLRAYEQASGRPVDPGRLAWYRRLVALRIMLRVATARRDALVGGAEKAAFMRVERALRADGM